MSKYDGITQLYGESQKYICFLIYHCHEIKAVLLWSRNIDKGTHGAY